MRDGGRDMPHEDCLVTRRTQEQGASQRRAVDHARTAGDDRTVPARRVSPAVPARYDALTAALRQRVAQRAARVQGAPPPLPGFLCERCLDAPAVLVQPAPGGGEMGVCAACQQEPLASDAVPQGEVSRLMPPPSRPPR